MESLKSNEDTFKWTGNYGKCGEFSTKHISAPDIPNVVINLLINNQIKSYASSYMRLWWDTVNANISMLTC